MMVTKLYVGRNVLEMQLPEKIKRTTREEVFGRGEGLTCRRYERGEMKCFTEVYGDSTVATLETERRRRQVAQKCACSFCRIHQLSDTTS